MNLRLNKIGDDGAAALAECLKHNTSLTMLYLHGKGIGDDGVAALAECLKYNKSLTTLDFCGNVMGDGGAVVPG